MATRKDKGKGKKPKRRQTAKIVERTEDLPPPRIPDVEAKAEVDEDPWGMDCLTDRQRKFVEAYIGDAAGNATKAAELAGYAAENRKSLKVTGHRLLTSANPAQAIAAALARRKTTPDWVKGRLVELASSHMANFISIDDNGNSTLDLKKGFNSGAIGQIKEYYEEGLGGAGGEPTIIKRKIKLYDPSASLNTLMTFFGLLNGENKDAQAERVIRFRPVTGGAVKPAEPAPAPPTNGDGNSQ